MACLSSTSVGPIWPFLVVCFNTNRDFSNKKYPSRSMCLKRIGYQAVQETTELMDVFQGTTQLGFTSTRIGTSKGSCWNQGNGTPYFRKHPSWWYIIPFGQRDASWSVVGRMFLNVALYGWMWIVLEAGWCMMFFKKCSTGRIHILGCFYAIPSQTVFENNQSHWLVHIEAEDGLFE